MAYGEVKLTREELYKKVWEKPLIKLAAEYGISDRGLAKIYKRYQIPLPGIGYWNRFQAGHNVTKNPLKPVTKKKNDYLNYDIVYIQNSIKPSIPSEISIQLQNAIDFDKNKSNIIEVKANHELTHNITLKLKQIFSEKRKHNEIYVITASEKELSRALIILDTLLSALESRGYKIILGEKYRVFVIIFNEKIELCIWERVKSKRYEPSKEERDKYSKMDIPGQPRIEYFKWLMSLPKWEYHNTGELILALHGDTYVKASISDTPIQPIENRLNSFLIKLYKAAVCIQANKEKARKEELKNEEEKSIRLEIQHGQEIYKRRVDFLLSNTEKFSQINKIHGFLRAIEERRHSLCLEKNQQDKLESMLAWIQDYISKNDPLLNLKNLLEEFS